MPAAQYCVGTDGIKVFGEGSRLLASAQLHGSTSSKVNDKLLKILPMSPPKEWTCTREALLPSADPRLVLMIMLMPLTLSMSLFERSSIPPGLEYSCLHTADRPSTSGYSAQLRHPTL
ncbi:hypothetical protein QUA54_00110 [Microcoleus sp. MOSTC5]|uniref:hypothetical protein n=1 Tax=Microcoleus sp. MOSTC5 TaxID=3055378 RepID=UPI002FD695BE